MPKEERTKRRSSARASRAKKDEETDPADIDAMVDVAPAATEEKEAATSAAVKTKATKREERHAAFLAKLGGETTATAEDDGKQKKRRGRKKKKTQVKVKDLAACLEECAAASNVGGALAGKTSAHFDGAKRQTMEAKESEQFRNVCALPAFKCDPLGAIKLHLKNQLATVRPSAK